MKIAFMISACAALFIGFNACKPAANTAKPVPPVADNSMNALDWEGVYSGVLPCADCEGIAVTLTIKRDNTYTVSKKYQGKPGDAITGSGKFSWNAEGNKIQLEGEAPGKYLVGENRLIHLDQSGNPITGPNAAHYTLTKQQPGITEKYWKLTELYSNPVTKTEEMAKEPHMILKAEGNRINVQGGCNSYFGTYELKPGDRIKFGQLAGTLMACKNMDIENKFLEALGAADSYYLQGDKLILNKARMAPLARFEAVYLR